ncbi:Transcription factor bHLH112 [Linum perenne]
MAEEFETGICGGSWWNNLVINPTRTTFIDGGGGGGGSSICSPTDFGSWLAAASSSPDVVISNNSSLNSDCFQNDSDSGGSTTTATAGVMMDSSALQMMGFGVGVSSSSPSPEDWNQRQQLGGGNYNSSMLEDEMNSCGRPLNNLTGLTSDHFCINPQQQPSNSIQGYPIQGGLFEPDSQQNPVFINNFSSPYGSGNSLLLNGLSPSWSKFQNPNHQNDNHQFSNNMSFWHNPTPSQTDNTRTNFLSAQTRFVVPSFDEKPVNCPNTSTKKPKNEEPTHNKESKSKTKKETNTESSFKRPRIETPSSLPTFKVRKEKLGDRITALQQLVSPFGKTDTASVLHEAIEYIKFLHDQVGVSSPYLN